jgi:hypothetical protein
MGGTTLHGLANFLYRVHEFAGALTAGDEHAPPPLSDCPYFTELYWLEQAALAAVGAAPSDPREAVTGPEDAQYETGPDVKITAWGIEVQGWFVLTWSETEAVQVVGYLTSWYALFSAKRPIPLSGIFWLNRRPIGFCRLPAALTLPAEEVASTPEPEIPAQCPGCGGPVDPADWCPAEGRHGCAHQCCPAGLRGRLNAAGIL